MAPARDGPRRRRPVRPRPVSDPISADGDDRRREPDGDLLSEQGAIEASRAATPVEVRRAQPADAEAIAAIHVRAWRAGYRGLLPGDLLESLSIEERERRWEATLSGENESWSTLVAIDGTAGVVGFCVAATPSRDDDADRPTAEIAATYVEPERWDSGIGTRLVGSALAELRAAGNREATLWVFAANRRARSLYRRLGFEPDGAEGEWKGAPTVRLRSRLTGMTLRPLGAGDGVALRRIRADPAVRRWWDEPEDGFPETDDPEARRFVIEVDGAVSGMIQYAEEAEPKYRHASVDLFLDPAVHGRGLGTEAVRRAVRHLIVDRGHHRVTIDPAASNRAAIRAYEKVGFRPVGVMRRYERDPDGDGWHDGLLMEVLAGEEAATEVLSPRARPTGGRDRDR